MSGLSTSPAGRSGVAQGQTEPTTWTLETLLARADQRWGDRSFLIEEDGGITFSQFRQRVECLAGALYARGIRRSDLVGVLLPNGPELLYSWFALARLGSIMVPLHPQLVPAEVEPLLRHLNVVHLISDQVHMDAHASRLQLRLKVVSGRARSNGALPFDQLLDSPERAPSGEPRPDDLTTLLHTSGTTGRPKAAALPQAGYVLPALEFAKWMQVTPEDRFLGVLPLFHMAGGAFAVSALASGASLVLVDHFSAHNFWDQVRRHEITLTRHLGQMLAVLCKLPATDLDRDHQLRAVYGGGARRDIAEAFTARFGAEVVEGYGLSETNTVLRNELGAGRVGSIGHPLYFARVRIADAHGRELGPGEKGEIQVQRNPVMMTGYYGDEERTAKAFDGEWFHTGDLGYHDEDDYFYFVGRKKEVIRRRGENLSPGEIETVLEALPEVAEAAVIGVPDEVGGEEAKAFVVLQQECRDDATDSVRFEQRVNLLVDHCHQRLAEFKIPRFFELCAEPLPRTATNKIQRAQLAKQAHGELGSCLDRRPPSPDFLAGGEE